MGKAVRGLLLAAGLAAAVGSSSGISSRPIDLQPDEAQTFRIQVDASSDLEGVRPHLLIRYVSIYSPAGVDGGMARLIGFMSGQAPSSMDLARIPAFLTDGVDAGAVGTVVFALPESAFVGGVSFNNRPGGYVPLGTGPGPMFFTVLAKEASVRATLQLDHQTMQEDCACSLSVSGFEEVQRAFLDGGVRAPPASG